MSDLTVTEFVTARLDEWEKAARLSMGAAHWTVDVHAVVMRQGATETVILSDASAERRDLEHIVRHDPARVLAQCAALREVLKIHRPHDHGGEHGDGVFCDECQWDHGDDSPRIDNQPVEGFGNNPCRTLLALAAIWSDRPDFHEEWRS